MYDPFAPPPPQGGMAITSAPGQPATNVAPVPGQPMPVDPGIGGPASGPTAAPPSGNNAIAQLFANGRGMDGGQGFMARHPEWAAQFGNFGDWRQARHDWRDAIRDWRQDRPSYADGGMQGFQDWRAARPTFQSFMQSYPPAQGIAVGEPAPLPVVPPPPVTG